MYIRHLFQRSASAFVTRTQKPSQSADEVFYSAMIAARKSLVSVQCGINRLHM